jgi:hypothetical protein
LPLTVGEILDQEEGHRYGWMAFFSESAKGLMVDRVTS